MRASRTPTPRLIQYHAPDLRFDGVAGLRDQIVAFVRGVRGKRQAGVTERQIVDWFRGTDPAFVRARLTEVCASGEVRCCMRSLGSRRRHGGGYVYEAAP